MIREHQLLIDTQVDINRAVFMYNNRFDSKTNSDPKLRQKYIDQCCRSAIKQLQKYLETKQLTLFNLSTL